MADAGTSGSGPRAHRGNGATPIGGTDSTDTDTGAGGTATVTTRGLPEPSPGPEVVRPAPRPRVRNKGDVASQKARARDRRAGAGTEAPAPAPTRRDTANAIQSAHADAATMLGLPELELSAAEAARVAAAFERTQALTGFTATGPMWDWLYVGYVLACVYLRRAFDIMARRRADADAAPAAAPIATAEPAGMTLAPLPAPIASNARTSPEPLAPTGAVKPNGPGNPPAAPLQTQESIAAALAHAAGTVAGFEKRGAGLPVSSIDERLQGI